MQPGRGRQVAARALSINRGVSVIALVARCVQIRAVVRKGKSTMRPGYYFAAIWLSVAIAAPAVAQTASPSKSPSPAATTGPESTAPPQERVGPVDINAASAEELDKLPGVGPARAKAIIAHRPYNGKDDLVQRKIVPQKVYNQIKDKIIARQGTASAPSGSAGSPSATTKGK